MRTLISKLLSRLQIGDAAAQIAVQTKVEPRFTFASQDRSRAEPSPSAAGSPSATLPVFDAGPLDALKTMMDPTKFTGLVGQFAQSLEERVQHLQQLLDGSNWADAAREAHDIVSVAGNIGAARLSSLARDLEKSCKASNEPGCQSLSAVFSGEATNALRALKTYQAAA